jgi:AcrR family transcriptional regulator
MRLFWERGFDGASLVDLADAMGIVRPSLHAAFGSKEDLYRQSIDLYSRQIMAFISKRFARRQQLKSAAVISKGVATSLLISSHPPAAS